MNNLTVRLSSGGLTHRQQTAMSQDRRLPNCKRRTGLPADRFALCYSLSWLLLLPTLLSILEVLSGARAMRIVVQRVKSASVAVDGASNAVAKIGPGILALAGLHEDDTVEDLPECCKKLLACKLWSNDSGGMWRQSVKQKQYEVLLVSQFTLYGTLSKKFQPDYTLAMKSEPASALWSQFVSMVRASYDEVKVCEGVFGAMMDVELVNDGPVTLVIESRTSRTAQNSSGHSSEEKLSDET
jgi:D-aminoacyl-tRNA deacylase